ncbi:hypothetical protein EDD18DRAFT_1113116 [Armillaria luteobubalina]|uniref:Uncharacterized protein n=1 Tax=Armillaria luteobubalina TaxID=153913 RepID=A0AA39UC40_9AGAR|nr:hypothetical protein EDD18DRAFT_1113116 [Armillaria luteobubalina]
MNRFDPLRRPNETFSASGIKHSLHSRSLLLPPLEGMTSLELNSEYSSEEDTDESTLKVFHNEMVEWIVEFEEQKQAAFDPDYLQKPVVLKHFAKGPDVVKMSQAKSAEYDDNMLVKSEPSKVFHDVNGRAELILVGSYVAELELGVVRKESDLRYFVPAARISRKKLIVSFPGQQHFNVTACGISKRGERTRTSVLKKSMLIIGVQKYKAGGHLVSDFEHSLVDIGKGLSTRYMLMISLSFGIYGLSSAIV